MSKAGSSLLRTTLVRAADTARKQDPQLAAGYLTQTFGLTLTSPGNAGLITGLFVVLTPLLNRLFGAPIHWWTWAATLVSLAGLVLLTGGPSGMNLGDLLVLACAVLFALHIVMLGRWSPGTATRQSLPRCKRQQRRPSRMARRPRRRSSSPKRFAASFLRSKPCASSPPAPRRP